MGKKITLTESQLIRVIERVVMEQQATANTDSVDSVVELALNKRNLGKMINNPKVQNMINGFKQASNKAEFILNQTDTIPVLRGIRKTVEKLLGMSKDKNFCTANVNIDKKLQTATGEKSTGIEFVVMIVVIIALVLFASSSAPRNCADQMFR